MNSKLSIEIDLKGRIPVLSLKDILMHIREGNNLKWAILWLEAIGDLGNNKSMLDFEKEINESKNGVTVEWENLITLSVKIEQVIELVLIGNKHISELRRYSNHEEMYSKCDYTIELIDSSYWTIHSTDGEALDYIESKLQGG